MISVKLSETGTIASIEDGKWNSADEPTRKLLQAHADSVDVPSVVPNPDRYIVDEIARQIDLVILEADDDTDDIDEDVVY